MVNNDMTTNVDTAWERLRRALAQQSHSPHPAIEHVVESYQRQCKQITDFRQEIQTLHRLGAVLCHGRVAADADRLGIPYTTEAVPECRFLCDSVLVFGQGDAARAVLAFTGSGLFTQQELLD